MINSRQDKEFENLIRLDQIIVLKIRLKVRNAFDAEVITYAFQTIERY